MTKAEQYCYDQGRGELKSAMNQLKACREMMDNRRKNKRQPDVAEELRVWLGEYGIETPPGGYALNLPSIGVDIRELKNQVEQRTKKACFKAGWRWIMNRIPPKYIPNDDEAAFKQAVKSAEVK